MAHISAIYFQHDWSREKGEWVEPFSQLKLLILNHFGAMSDVFSKVKILM